MTTQRWVMVVVALAPLLLIGADARVARPAARAAHVARGGAPTPALCEETSTPGRRGSPLLRTLPISNGVAVAVDERSGHVFVLRSFVSNSLGDTSAVCMLDARTGALLRATAVGKDALALAVDSRTERVFVANTIDPSVSVLDARTGALLRTVPLTDDARVIAVAEQAGRVFLTDGHRQLVSILDARKGTLLRTVHAGAGPFALATSAATNQVFVANFDGSSVSVLDAHTGVLLHVIHVGAKPQAIAVDPRTRHAFVSSQEGPLSMFSTLTDRVLRTAPVDALPTQLAVDQSSHRLFLNLLPDTGGAVSVYDTGTGSLLHTTAVANQPISTPVVDVQTGRVLVLLNSPVTVKDQRVTGPGALVALDSTTGVVRTRVAVGDVFFEGGPLDSLLAVDEQTQRAFALTGGSVVVLDATRL